jgi:hypothetical protein
MITIMRIFRVYFSNFGCESYLMVKQSVLPTSMFCVLSLQSFQAPGRPRSLAYDKLINPALILLALHMYIIVLY